MKALFCTYILMLKLLLHPFYVSITEIEYNPASQSLEIAMKIFVDDLNTAMETHLPERIWLGDSQENTQANLLLQQYLLNRVQIKVNETPVTFQWIGREIEEDACWVYLEVPKIPTLNSLEISHRLLMEVFPGQSNIVHIRKDKEVKSLTLRKEKSTGQVVF